MPHNGIKMTHFLRNNLGTILPKNTRAVKKKLLRSSWPNSLHFMPSVHAWHKMQRIRPSWTVIAFSGFAHERNKNPRWRRPGVKNIEHLGAYFLSRLSSCRRLVRQLDFWVG